MFAAHSASRQHDDRRTSVSNAGSRHGISLIEMLAAGSLLSTIALVMVPFLSRLSDTRQHVADREFAIRELRNAAEDLMMDDSLTPAKLNSERFTPLDQVQTRVERTALKNGGERIDLSVSWVNSSGERSPPVMLSFWKAPAEVTSSARSRPEESL